LSWARCEVELGPVRGRAGPGAGVGTRFGNSVPRARDQRPCHAARPDRHPRGMDEIDTRYRATRLTNLARAAFGLHRLPTMASWGSTPAEVVAVLPGDELVGQAKYRTTHAVSIDAAPEEVWPWLVQMGQGRGGLYSYDWLENLIGLHMHSAECVRPDLQGLTVGDIIRMVPEGTEPPLRFAVARLEPPNLLVLGPDGSRAAAFAHNLPYPCWTFQVTATDDGRSRLVVRFQSDFRSTRVGWVMNKYALLPIHFVMERKMLLGIKERVERAA
jgi:hypothetical protein